MNDKKERVYSEEDLCEYTILQKIDELEKQLKNIKNEFNDLYETKEEANVTHRFLRSNDAKINNRINDLTNITPTDIIASASKLSLGVGNAPLGNGVNLDGFTYDEVTKTLKVSGGELTGEALMNTTKDSATITRTLDTDGKVKLDAIGGGGGGTNVEKLSFKINVSTGDMQVGDVKSFISSTIRIDTTNTTTLCYVPFYFSTVNTPYDTNTATTLIITEYIEEDNGKANMKISIICLKAGKYTANLTFSAKRLYTNK